MPKQLTSKIPSRIISDPFNQAGYINYYHNAIAPKLGKGYVLPVVYDTAWLARIPNLSNTNKPAFPGALHWLRAQQLPDGSWGCLHPYHAQSNTLSTLAAILALVQWHKKSDMIRIKRAIESLSKMVTQLPSVLQDTIGFELILPALLNECQKLNLDLSSDINHYCQTYFRLCKQKKSLIKKFSKYHKTNEPVSWWFSLEMLGSDFLTSQQISIPFQESLLSAGGSVAASPAATAYLLTATRWQHKDIPKAFDYLKKLINNNPSRTVAVPDVAPIDEFELAFSCNYLLDAGIPASNPLLSHLISLVAQKWAARQQMGIGYSSHFTIDPDCSAVAIRVLHAAGYRHLDSNILLNFFNNSYIETYGGERTPSISTNLHVVTALRLLPSTQTTRAVIQKIVQWLKQQAQLTGPIFTDKWHASPIYPISTAVLTLTGIADQLAKHCVEWLLTQQQDSGAWGELGTPSLEETAFASLALAHWQQHSKNIPVNCLQQAKIFLGHYQTLPQQPLWIGKVLYCPQYVVLSLLAAANIALTTTLKSQFRLRDKVDFSRQKTSHFRNHQNNRYPKSTAGILHVPNLHSYLLCMYAPKLANARHSALMTGCLQVLQNASSATLQLYYDYAKFTLTLDDLLDKSWQMFANKQQLIQVFKIFNNIINNHNIFNSHTIESSWKEILHKTKDQEILLTLQPLFYLLMDIYKRLTDERINTQFFTRSIKQFFRYSIVEFEIRNKNIVLSPEKYLNIRRIAAGIDPSCELAFSLLRLSLPKKMRCHPLFAQLKYHAYEAFIIANDLFSYKKDLLENNRLYNYITIIHAKKAPSLNAAFQTAIQQHNQAMIAFLTVKNDLLSSFNHDIYLTKIIDVIQDQIMAHMEWAMVTDRYY
jgi:halimadienyl-diphosphate synthase